MLAGRIGPSPPFRLSRWCDCTFGPPFQKSRQWLSNQPWMGALPTGCSCEYRNRHMVVRGAFDAAGLRLFSQRC
eukprot:6605249-Lingulodinium_polyedra.AAC.1